MYYYILEVRHELVSFSSHELSVWPSRILFFNLVPWVLLFFNMAAKLQNRHLEGNQLHYPVERDLSGG